MTSRDSLRRDEFEVKSQTGCLLSFTHSLLPKLRPHQVKMSQLHDLEQIYEKAWGQKWPSHRGYVTIEAEFSNDSDTPPEEEDDLNDDDSDENTSNPRSWSYTSLLDIPTLCSSLQLPTKVLPRLVVRKEFEFLRGELEGKVRDFEEKENAKEKEKRYGLYSNPSFVVTGQSGIGTYPHDDLSFNDLLSSVAGKTTFLIYILLYRLSLRLSTAFQTTPNEYLLFDEEGVSIFDAHDLVDRLEARDVWCLCVGNSTSNRNSNPNSNVVLNTNTSPCVAFLSSDSVVIQTTSAPMKVWKNWRRQNYAEVVYMDLPREIEVAGIMYVLRLPHLPSCSQIPFLKILSLPILIQLKLNLHRA